MPFVNIKIQVRGMLKHRLAQFYAELQLNDECLQAVNCKEGDSNMTFQAALKFWEEFSVHELQVKTMKL